MPVVDYYRAQGKVIEVRLIVPTTPSVSHITTYQIDSTPPPAEVHKTVKVAMDAAFALQKSTLNA